VHSRGKVEISWAWVSRPTKFLAPFHATEVAAILARARRIIVVENN